MVDKDSFAERGRALEEEYFRKKDQELVEKMRKAASAARAQTELSAETGLTDPAMLQQLQDLGFTPETVTLLPLVPLVQMAWAEGGVTASERALIVKLARARGIVEGGVADQQLTGWLDRRPETTVFTQAARLIRAMLDTPHGAGLTADEIIRHSESIAEASGGFFGINRISTDEKQILASLAEELKGRKA
jgi:hypothetical protein